jgi:hypothetical protein
VKSYDTERWMRIAFLLVDQAQMEKIVRIAEHLAEPLKLQKKKTKE